MGKVRPGKGAQFMLSQPLIDWVQDTMAIINDAYDGEQNDADPKVVIKTLCMEHGFEYEKDNYGEKAYKSTPYPVTADGGEVRITVVLVKKTGVLSLDIRPWADFPQNEWRG
jgi:hypothetical protein